MTLTEDVIHELKVLREELEEAASKRMITNLIEDIEKRMNDPVATELPENELKYVESLGNRK